MVKRSNIAIIGLGYVGLPLAVEFGKKCKLIGFDNNSQRIHALKKHRDSTNEVDRSSLKAVSGNLVFTDNLDDIKGCNFYIVTVPTPILSNNEPDLKYIKNASHSIGKILKKGDIVVFESTVYPGATREICIPILEKESSLKINRDFFVGYSPERINPGDKLHRVSNIKKIVAGSDAKSAKQIQKVYSRIIKAGTFLASSIEVAEAAKVIENTQRDLNIALMNELSIIFDKLEIDTQEVIKAAATKWNFSEYYPGFVGGHCIGVDPYYLTFKAKSIGYNPKVILGGRNLNDGMSKIIANRILQKSSLNRSPKILVMGFTFKENCPDTRNTKISDFVSELIKNSNSKTAVDVFDPWINQITERENYADINFVEHPKSNYYDLCIISVGHSYFKKLGIKNIRSFLKKNGKIWDLKYLFSKEETDFRM